MAEQRIRVALLGAGGFASTAHLPAIAATPAFDLVAVYSRSRSSADKLVQAAQRFPATSGADLAVYSDDSADGATLDALLARDDIPAVVLCLPIPHQPAVIRRALAAGKHVVSEKPAAASVADTRALVELYEAEYAPKGQQWIVAEQFCYGHAWEKARELVRDGKLGTVQSFAVDVFIQPSLAAGATNWRREPEYQGGFLLDGGVHFFAALRHILSTASPSPLALTSLSAHVSQLNPSLPPCDTLHALVGTSSARGDDDGSATGPSGTFTLSFGHPKPAQTKLYTLRGDRAVLTIDIAHPRIHVLRLVTQPSPADPDAAGEDEPNVLEIELPARDAVEAEVEAFARALVAGIGSKEADEVRRRSGPRAALRDVAAVEGALKSGEKGGEKIALKELVGEALWEVQ
ncbi:Gfo/Idh/MocA family protein [Rhodotorula paludigena]|uniref:Gfo/Idh/MocA family protein n=1 Tax=Rhodotorula paludigena TaxID=86838 RepID=UPI0031721381